MIACTPAIPNPELPLTQKGTTRCFKRENGLGNSAFPPVGKSWLSQANDEVHLFSFNCLGSAEERVREQLPPHMGGGNLSVILRTAGQSVEGLFFG